MQLNNTKLLAWSGFISTLLIGSVAVAQGPSGAKKRFEPPPTTNTQPESSQSLYPARQYPQQTSPVQPQPAPHTYSPEHTAPSYEPPYESAESQTASVSADQSAGNYWSSRHLGVSARVGTLGLGVELTTQLIQDRLNLRVGFNSFSYNYEAEGDDDGGGDNGDGDLEYDGDLKLRSLPLLVDFHPFKGGFRATAGLVFNSSEITGNARCNEATCEFGDESFDRDTLGTTGLKVDLGGSQPYLGIGWGNAVHSVGRWAFAFDLGVVFQDVDVSITPSDSCRADARCNAEVEREREELEDDADDIDMYPVLSFGLSYKFL